jgi:hypothetical protein
MPPSALVEKNKNAAIAMELDLQSPPLIVPLECHRPLLAHYAIILRLHAIANNNNKLYIAVLPEKLLYTKRKSCD